MLLRCKDQDGNYVNIIFGSSKFLGTKEDKIVSLGASKLDDLYIYKNYTEECNKAGVEPSSFSIWNMEDSLTDDFQNALSGHHFFSNQLIDWKDTPAHDDLVRVYYPVGLNGKYIRVTRTYIQSSGKYSGSSIAFCDADDNRIFVFSSYGYSGTGYQNVGFYVDGDDEGNVINAGVVCPMLHRQYGETYPYFDRVAYVNNREYTTGGTGLSIQKHGHETIKDCFADFFGEGFLPTGPLDEGGNSEEGGGEGDFDDSSDKIGFSALPGISAIDTGLVTLYAPTSSQLRNFSNYLWSDLFDLDNFKKLFSEPMEAILGLSIVPFNIPTNPSTIRLGNVDTLYPAGKVTAQYLTVDCGTINASEYWGSALDYNPYTQFEIFLPYIGTRPLDADHVMKKPLHVIYNIDILSGSCNAQIMSAGSVLYSFGGNISSQIPVTSENFSNMIRTAISAVSSAATGIMGGAAAAPMAISMTAGAVTSMKSNVEKSGGIGGTSGLLGIQRPYLIKKRPKQSLPKNYNKYLGFTSNITSKLSDLSGYTKVEEIHMEGIRCEKSELDELENILKGGFIV